MQAIVLGENVIISGLTAAGKTTHCHLLAGEFGLRYVSGSQILLYLSGRFPVQRRDFWVSDEAQTLWKSSEADRVDEELARLESTEKGLVIDSLATPWLHRDPAFKIWLESSLESRVTKALISHQGTSHFSRAELEARLQEKDQIQRERFLRKYGFDLLLDRRPFELILDISQCIKGTTLKDALGSIRAVHSLIRPAVGWHLTGDPSFRDEFEEAQSRSHDAVVVQCPKGLSNIDRA
jgi:cytidylate kinase